MRTLITTQITLALLTTGCALDYDAFHVQGGAFGGHGNDGTGAGASGGGASGGAASGGDAAGGDGASANGGSAGNGNAGGIGGSGGSGTTCGDGIIDPGEECDSGPSSSVGCVGCQVECAAAGEVEHPTTHHCYYRDYGDQPRTWADGRVYCKSTWGGGDLAVIETMAEYDFLLGGMTMPNPQQFFFLGANGGPGTYTWLDGSIVAYPTNQPPWMDSEPNGNGDCLIWRVDQTPASEGFGDLGCTASYHPFCERPPAGTP